MRLSNVAWNAGGLLLPLAVAALTVPQMLERLGHERFGLLTLAWGLIGYAGAMDLGIGRALTQRVAGLRGMGEFGSIPDVLATAGRITLFAGLLGGILIALAAALGVGAWVRTDSTPTGEIRDAILLLAIALPAQAMTATYRGMNEGFLKFKEISLLRAGLGVINFGGPYLVSLLTTQLPWLVSTLVVSRWLALVVFRHLAIGCLESGGGVKRHGAYSNRVAASLFSFGAWVTLSGVVSPILVQADRFLIASAISAAAVSIYVLPYEVVVQSLVLAGAVSSVMFPGLSQLIREKPDQWPSYFKKWLWRIAVTMAIVCSALLLLLPKFLSLWIKDDLRPESVVIGQVLCIGVFANAIGSMFYALLHAKGRADITAKLHLAELPIFIGFLTFMVVSHGVIGAAWAWVGRMVLDAGLLAGFARFGRA
ncbi:Lipopolysaccharide biosynthesis protein WzxC [Variovorax sp. PBL-H6]|uniref:oligosaccharide flippase family protein n=1 Tax=Variovorax sp. PBL-H6 TaxID=434009 RepID=UPI0013175D22|nr:oligosaccharide flippase family protein [Variovorax sp. PBL-H6]VTU38665.1 Lipopolysaccharide biosynthesis protein WzxC [Variovorax sp. PBL-H6]